MVCQLTPTLFKRRVQECHQLEKNVVFGAPRGCHGAAHARSSHMLCRSRQILSAPLGAFEVTPDFLGWERSHTHSASECVNEKLFSGALHPSRAKFALVEIACAQLILPPISRKSGAAPPACGGGGGGCTAMLTSALWWKKHDCWGIAVS